MAKNETPRKAKSEKVYTRMQAIRALAAGADPEPFAKHSNYHVRAYAWRKMGKPLPTDAAELDKFLLTLTGKEAPKDPGALVEHLANLRAKFLPNPLSFFSPAPSAEA